MRAKYLIVPAAVLLLTVSCFSGPVVIPENLTPAELIQRGQEASDRNRFSNSLQYYNTLIDRFPFNTDDVCAAEYEIAFIYYKQKKYDLARNGFNSLLERYNAPDEQLLPQQYKILSRIVLAKIEEVDKKKKK